MKTKVGRHSFGWAKGEVCIAPSQILVMTLSLPLSGMTFQVWIPTFRALYLFMLIFNTLYFFVQAFPRVKQVKGFNAAHKSSPSHMLFLQREILYSYFSFHHLRGNKMKFQKTVLFGKISWFSLQSKKIITNDKKTRIKIHPSLLSINQGNRYTLPIFNFIQ